MLALHVGLHICVYMYICVYIEKLELQCACICIYIYNVKYICHDMSRLITSLQCQHFKSCAHSGSKLWDADFANKKLVTRPQVVWKLFQANGSLHVKRNWDMSSYLLEKSKMEKSLHNWPSVMPSEKDQLWWQVGALTTDNLKRKWQPQWINYVN